MSVRINFEIGHEAAIRTKHTVDGFTHDWELFVSGCDNADIHQFVEKVVFYLHNTFPNPKRVVKEPPYKVRESGYAGFTLPIEIYLRNNDEPKKIRFTYDLNLQPSGPPIRKLQKEKYVFTNPSEEFRHKLLKGGGYLINADISTSSDKKVKVKSGSNSEVKKHRVKEHKQEDSFTDLFGTPITKTSKISPEPKVVPVKTSPVPGAVKVEGESSKKAKSKHSPKDKDREKEKKERSQEKKHKEEKKSKERSKDKERKDKSVKRERSPKQPSTSPSRGPSPKRPPSPAKKPEEKKAEEPKEKKPEAKKSKHDKDKDKEKHKSQHKDKEAGKEKDKSGGKEAKGAKEPYKNKEKAASNHKPPEEPLKEGKKPEKLPKPEKVETEKKHKHKKKDSKEKKEKKEEKSKEKSKEKKGESFFERVYKEEVKDSPKEPEKPQKPPEPPCAPSDSGTSRRGENRGLSALQAELDNSSDSSVISHDESSIEVPSKPEKKKSESGSGEKKRKRKHEPSVVKEEEAQPPVVKEEPAAKMIREEPEYNSTPPADVKKEPDEENTQDYMSILKDLQHKIMTLQDNSELQRVVKLIADTGHYEITPHTFDFDLCALDRDTVRRLQEFFTVS